MQKDDETVKMKGFKGFSNVFGSAKRQPKMTVDEATCRVIGKRGLVERQKSRGYECLEFRASAT